MRMVTHLISSGEDMKVSTGWRKRFISHDSTEVLNEVLVESRQR